MLIGVVLAVEMKSLLIGEAATPDVVRRIRGEIERGPGVRRVLHLLAQHLGPDEVPVAAKVQFEPALSTAEHVEAINACEARLRAAGAPDRLVVYIEPDVPERSASAAALAGG